ncbi:MAG: hypothetical protein M3327_12040 [Actinomycetota bacterium]|nr:hypothetical protein [Actinomycetota bacterium]
MRLAEQWSEILADLPRAWEAVSLSLALDEPEQARRAALVLGPAAPARRDSSFRIDVVREARPIGTSAALFRRVLHRLDDDGIGGQLSVLTAGGATDEERDGEAITPARGLAGHWLALLEGLPPDWSHLLAQLDLDSSDFLERAALLIVPTNPARLPGSRSFRFRVARRVGYGVSPGMARRSCERLDQERITGRLSLVQVVSDARPVATQGPVWRIGGRAV